LPDESEPENKSDHRLVLNRNGPVNAGGSPMDVELINAV
jgi:hypothetical protein